MIKDDLVKITIEHISSLLNNILRSRNYKDVSSCYTNSEKYIEFMYSNENTNYVVLIKEKDGYFWMTLNNRTTYDNVMIFSDKLKWLKLKNKNIYYFRELFLSILEDKRKQNEEQKEYKNNEAIVNALPKSFLRKQKLKKLLNNDK